MPKRPCLEPGCPNFATARGRCDDHRRTLERDRSRRRRADPDRGKRVQVYHSKRWLVLRKSVLFEQPICAEPDCTRLATDVDHIVPMSHGGGEFERDNCQGLCAHHHSLKSAREGGFPDAA